MRVLRAALYFLTMIYSEDIRRQVELMPWPETIGEDGPDSISSVCESIGALTIERDTLLEENERLRGSLRGTARARDAWHWLATLFGLMFAVLAGFFLFIVFEGLL